MEELKKKNGGLERLGIVSIEDAFMAIASALADGNTLAEIGEFQVKSGSQRYELFMTKGTTCVCCGLKAQYFGIERHITCGPRPHLNLYGIDDAGDEVLFTKDHIVAIANKGKNIIKNYQTMCMPCNREKGAAHV